MTLASEDDLALLASTSGVLSVSPVHLLSMPDPVDSKSLNWPAPDAQWVASAAAPAVSASASVSANTTVGNVTVPVNSTQITNSSAPSNSTASPLAANVKVLTARASNTKTVCTGILWWKKCTNVNIVPPTPSQPAEALTGFSNLPQIQADRVHAQGNKGKGVKIGIIDGGVDYTRPTLGGCFGPGCKIAGGYDFVGDNYDGSNTPVPDDDPIDLCYSHGTIVAGIIAAGDNEYNVTGVAPEASIYQYRVFGCNGATTDDIVIQAMMRAYQDDVDVLNLSLGELSGWTNGALAVVASRLARKGVVVTVSAGNQGQVGAWYAYSPAAGLGVINVGSTDNAINPAQQLNVSTGYGPITCYNFQPWTMSATMPLDAGAQYPITAYTTDPSVPNDGCILGDADLRGQIVVVRRGGCSLSDKAQFAFRQGAIGILVVNDPFQAPLQQNFPLINYGMISNEDGGYLLGEIAAGNNVTLSFSFSPIAVPNTYTGNTTSYFSEVGPTNDMFFAPSITAPGQNIINVIPYNPDRFFYNWTISDGTSWSSAFAAGSAALYLNAKGNRVTSKAVLEAFENTAVALPFSRSDPTPLSVSGQGSGKLQVFDSINSGLVVSPAELTLNDTAYFNSVQHITLRNTGQSSVRYTLSNVPAGTAMTFGEGAYNMQPNNGPVPQIGGSASVQLSKSSVMLRAGSSTVVTLRFTAPTGLDATKFPVYSGWIQITGGNNNVQVPYMGVAARMRDMPVIDSTEWAFGFKTPVITGAGMSIQNGPQTYTFQNGDFPTIIYRRTAGTPILVLDLVSADASLGFTPTYNYKRDERSFSPRRLLGGGDETSGGRGLLRFWCQITKNKGNGCQANNNGNTFNKVPTLGTLLESNYIARNSGGADGVGLIYSTYALSTPTFLNGTTIPNGTYKFLLRALKITGNVKKQEDYESWLSLPFTIAA